MMCPSPTQDASSRSAIANLLKRDPPAMAVVDRGGAVVWSSARTNGLLNEIASYVNDQSALIANLVVLAASGGDASQIVGESHALRCFPLDGPGDMFVLVVESAKRRDPLRSALERYRLTQREGDVARLLVEGCATSTIANRLSIAGTTVLDHVKNIAMKLGVSRRSAIVAKLLEADETRTVAFAEPFLLGSATRVRDRAANRR